MAKRTRKRVLNGKDQSGCMWGFMNIFEFRHDRPTHKLIADRKRGSRRIVGAACRSGELKKAEDSCGICKDVNAGELYETSSLDKLSVKSLMEEEMFEQDIHSDKHGHERKKSWHSKKKSFDLNDVHFVSEKPAHRKHKSLSSIDVSGMMEELCSQVNVQNGDCLNHEQFDEDVSVPQKEDLSSTEERLEEATRVFVRHFVEGRNTEQGKMQPSVELLEALRILNSNKDMFLRLLRDPSSELGKHLEDLEDHPLETRSDMIEQPKSKHQGFFRRRFKGLERNSSKTSKLPKDASTIVVLKPQSAVLQRDQDDERGSSRFSLTELTRKLKLAMRKEDARMDNIDDVVGESLRMASPSGDNLFGKELSIYSSPEQRISNIYTEAKKHLAEIIGNSDEDVEFLSKQDPESLGRILSYSDHNRTPISSPRKDEEQISADNNCITSEETRDDFEVPDDESSPLHSVVDEIHAEEMKSPDDFETENHISPDTLPEPCNPNNERVEETPNDSEEVQTLKLNLDDVVTSQLSSPSSSSSSSVCSRTEEFEDLEASTDRSERPSPISVLEPIFVDDVDVSPPRIKSFSVSELIQPRQIKFEDRVSRSPRLRTWAEEKNAVLEFVEAVARASGLTHDQLLERFLFSNHLLDPSLLDHISFHHDHFDYDPKLLFDLVGDVLTEVCSRDFDGIPLYTRMKLTRKILVDEIRHGVDWHLQAEHTKRTLDQTVSRDFSKLWTWMDLRSDSESLGVEMEEEIFNELVKDAITSFVS